MDVVFLRNLKDFQHYAVSPSLVLGCRCLAGSGWDIMCTSGLFVPTVLSIRSSSSPLGSVRWSGVPHPTLPPTTPLSPGRQQLGTLHLSPCLLSFTPGYYIYLHYTGQQVSDRVG